jgi:three-Cys-motif partner protein
MSKITSTIWQIEPHTEAKHAILRKYLDAWLPIITRWNGRVIYIDGFAGPGEYIGGEDGSPIIAIKAVLEHRANINAKIRMLFIEAVNDRCEFLLQKVKGMEVPSNISTECICAKFDETLETILNYLDEQKARIAPAFIFIDPFGFTGIPFSLIKRIMGNEKCEVMITFMYEEINRFVADKRLWNGLNETFGTEKWEKVISEDDSRIRELLLHGIYKEQLKKEANIKFVHSFKMTNKTNRTDYFLFFGTNNIMGLKKMKEAMWKVDDSGVFEFSDATFNPTHDKDFLFVLAPNPP